MTIIALLLLGAAVLGVIGGIIREFVSDDVRSVICIVSVFAIFGLAHFWPEPGFYAGTLQDALLRTGAICAPWAISYYVALLITGYIVDRRSSKNQFIGD